MVIVPGMQDTPSIQPKLTPEDVQLLRQLNERDRQVLGGMPRPRAAMACGYSVTSRCILLIHKTCSSLSRPPDALP